MCFEAIVCVFHETRMKAESTRFAGYAFLIDKLGLRVMPHWRVSLVSSLHRSRSSTQRDCLHVVYPRTYWPGDGIWDHLVFALKYDGINLALLFHIFSALDGETIRAGIHTAPQSHHARRIWFLYEFLLDRQLEIPDLTRGNYIPVLDAAEYVTLSHGTRQTRHKVLNNLPGTSAWCPTIRRTEAVRQIDSADLEAACGTLLASYSPRLVHRALGYLYGKETRSSFEIEHITPSVSRVERFIGMLGIAATLDYCTHDHLIELQNGIVDARFRERAYRRTQNYVGEFIAWQHQRVHYISPRPEDLGALMDGLLDTHARMLQSDIDAMVHAAVISFGFVFLHPFEDGNGRMHRFLIHNILAMRGVVPAGLMFPVSATMRTHQSEYDAALEAFSKPLAQCIDFDIDAEGRLKVHNDTAAWYRFMDMTPQVEALARFIRATIDEVLKPELDFLVRYDATRSELANIIDMPDAHIDLFIHCCFQNNGRLAKRKRTRHFPFLTSEEVEQMEAVVGRHYVHGAGGGVK